jgi:hypothetical protein
MEPYNNVIRFTISYESHFVTAWLLVLLAYFSCVTPRGGLDSDSLFACYVVQYPIAHAYQQLSVYYPRPPKTHNKFNKSNNKQLLFKSFISYEISLTSDN